MKKVKLLIVAIIAAVIFMPIDAQAGSCAAQDGLTYTIAKGPDKPFTGIQMRSNASGSWSNWNQRLYYVTDSSGKQYDTYCLDAGRPAPTSQTFSCFEEIDISKASTGNEKAFFTAMTKAYQYSIGKGYTDNNVLTLVFRLLTYRYGYAQSLQTGGSELPAAFYPIQNYLTSGRSTFRSDGSDVGNEKMRQVNEIYDVAIAAGEAARNLSYEQIVNQNTGVVWGDSWTFTKQLISSNNSERRYRITAVPAFDITGETDINYNQFAVDCNGTTMNCSIDTKTIKEMPAEPSYKNGYVIYEVVVTNYQGVEPPLYQTSDMYDPRSASANMMFIHAPGSAVQRMLIVSKDGLPITPINPSKPVRSRTRTPIDPSTDYCTKNSDGKYYYKGKEVTDIDEMNKLGCPTTCSIINNEFICKDGKRCTEKEAVKNGSMTAEQYYNQESECGKQPPKQCGKTPEESGMTEEEFIEECCDNLDKDSDEYIYYCTKACKPDYTIPSDCLEFNDPITQDRFGYINDITDESKVKVCVVSSKTTTTTGSTGNGSGSGSGSGTGQTTGDRNAAGSEFAQYCDTSKYVRGYYDLTNNTYICCDGVLSYDKKASSCYVKDIPSGQSGWAKQVSGSWKGYYRKTMELSSFRRLDEQAVATDSDLRKYCPDERYHAAAKNYKTGEVMCCDHYFYYGCYVEKNGFYNYTHVANAKYYTVGTTGKTYEVRPSYGSGSSGGTGGNSGGTTTIKITDRNDAAGNPYLMTDQDTVADNPYCKISCKEKASFSLPGAQYTQSGSYFSLKATVEGERDCYSSEIDELQFKKDLIAAVNKMLADYNEFTRYKTAMNHIDSRNETATDETYHSSTCSNPDGSTYECGSCSSSTGCSATIWYVKAYSYTALLLETDANFNITGYKTETRNQAQDVVPQSGYTEDASCEGTGKCQDGTRDTIVSRITAQMNSTRTVYQASLKAIQTNVVDVYNDCAIGWENDIQFDPILDFTYKEPYKDDINGPFVQVESHETKDNEMYCTGETNNAYECISGAKSSSNPKKNQASIKCDDNGCVIEQKQVTSAKWVHKEKAISGTYAPSHDISTYSPWGTIVFNQGTNKLYTSLPEDSLPIALLSKTGVYQFKFGISNIGQFNSDNTMGRLIGASNSVYQKIAQKNKLSTEAGYVCQYVLNCDGCDFECEGDKCDFIDEDDKCGPEGCTHVCEDCIFDGNEANYTYKTVSLNKLFPTNRTLGYNWNTKKGQYTIKTIEETNNSEEIYNSKLEYSYTITRTQLARIKRYNKEVGSYVNEKDDDGNPALVCENKNGYENIICKSQFLGDGNGTYFEQIVRNESWTLWTELTCDNGKACAIGAGQGPAWK